MRGSYTYDFYFMPTVILHNTGLYTTLELAWLKWYIGVIVNKEEK